MLLSIQGEEASGKTTLAYTAPPPVVGFQFDLGHERALYGAKYPELFADKKVLVVPYEQTDNPKPQWQGNDITIYELPSPVQLLGIHIQGCSEAWAYFIQLVAKALTDDYVASIVVDTMTVARRIRADAHLQDLQAKAFDDKGSRKPSVELREQLLQIEWGRPNDSIRDLYTATGGAHKNLAATHHLTDERADKVDDKGKVTQVLTGKRILEGLSQTHRFVDMAVLTRKNGNHQIEAKVLKCGYVLDLEGMEISNPTWEGLVSTVKMRVGDRLRI